MQIWSCTRSPGVRRWFRLYRQTPQLAHVDCVQGSFIGSKEKLSGVASRLWCRDRDTGRPLAGAQYVMRNCDCGWTQKTRALRLRISAFCAIVGVCLLEQKIYNLFSLTFFQAWFVNVHVPSAHLQIGKWHMKVQRASRWRG